MNNIHEYGEDDNKNERRSEEHNINHERIVTIVGRIMGTTT